MSNNPANRRSAATAALALVLLAGAANCPAQTATEPPANTPDRTPAPDPQDSPQPDSPSSAPAEDEKSPFDYRSSEEISEDLSVSYPVDI
jgi:hypothetical protein